MEIPLLKAFDKYSEADARKEPPIRFMMGGLASTTNVRKTDPKQ